MIGHRGAAAVAPENSLAGLRAALAAGVDLVEFDVGEGLLLGHGTAADPGAVTLDAALDLLAATTVGIQIDVKTSGNEAAIVACIVHRGLERRTVVSSTSARSLRRFRALAPTLTRALSYPHDRYGASRLSWPPPVTRAAAAALRAVMPLRAIGLVAAAGGIDALSLHHTLVSKQVVAAVHRRGPAVLAWTVNGPARVEELVRVGVDAITSDAPEMVIGVLGRLELP